MKNVERFILTTVVCLIAGIASGQGIGDRILKKAKQRVDRKVDRTIDKGLDEVEEGVDETVSGGGDAGEGGSQPANEPSKGGSTEAGTTAPAAGKSTGSEEPSFAAYSKFDFVPGEKVIVLEDFSQDAIGDFPDKWNTDGGGEIVTIEGEEGHWLSFNTKGSLTPEFINNLPENFTLEFDLTVNPGYSFYDSYFWIRLVERENSNQFDSWQNHVQIGLHPRDAGSGPYGVTRFFVFQDGSRTMMNDRSNMSEFNILTRRRAHIAMWRQNQQLRLYVNESKIWDLPKAFKAGANYNGIIFEKETAKTGNNYYIHNIRLAVGNPDTRNKLLTEGKFSTTGIYFATNSASIKPESHGVLKEIADVLQTNPDVKISIVGHTDSDGDDAHNLDLSKKRAAAVKDALVGQFGIDGSRIQTDGKGEASPTGDNATAEGKAANRRVEFIKL